MKKTDSLYDALISGSGLNSMAAGVLLEQAGWPDSVRRRCTELTLVKQHRLSICIEQLIAQVSRTIQSLHKESTCPLRAS